jgi:hypothetical protein
MEVLRQRGEDIPLSVIQFIVSNEKNIMGTIVPLPRTAMKAGQRFLSPLNILPPPKLTYQCVSEETREPRGGENSNEGEEFQTKEEEQRPESNCADRRDGSETILSSLDLTRCSQSL